MPIEIPFDNTFASFSEEVILDNVPYILVFKFNTLGEYWTVAFYDRNSQVLISGIKLVLAYELLSQHRGRGLPPGELFVIDTTEDFDRVTRNNLGDSLSLIYVEENEVDTI
jgi:hypothetical protein